MKGGLLAPPRGRPGDSVAVVAPSARAVAPGRTGRVYFESHGLEVRINRTRASGRAGFLPTAQAGPTSPGCGPEKEFPRSRTTALHRLEELSRCALERRTSDRKLRAAMCRRLS